MIKGAQNILSFHLAGIVPIAGQKLDFNFPWHDCMQPINKNYLAVERAVLECAYAGCETIWIICHDDMQPLIRYRLGEYIHDPVFLQRKRISAEGEPKEIPIYYVPIHPKDRDRRDCLGWSVLHGAQTAYWLSKTISKWIIPDKYYVAFPYGIYAPESLQEHRKAISSKKPFFVSHEEKTIKDNEYLGFTFDADDFKACRAKVRKEAIGASIGYNIGRHPIEKRWSARFFALDKVFESVNIKDASMLKVLWYYNISSWDGLCNFLGSSDNNKLDKPPSFRYYEWSPIGVNNEE